MNASEASDRWELVRRKELPCSNDGELCRLWTQYTQTGASPDTAALAVCPPARFRNIKESAATLYIRANVLLAGIQPYLYPPDAGIALFSQEGCLLKLYGGLGFLEWTRAQGIVPGTLWCGERIPFNGVSAGFQLQRPVHLDGWGNYARTLSGVSISFAPVVMNGSDGHTILGGIAVLAPAEKHAVRNLLPAVSLAREVMLSCWQFRTSVSLAEANINSGIVTVDQTQGRNQVLISNSYFFKVLKISPRDIQGKSLEDIFDPPPRNGEFWALIKNPRPVRQRTIRLSAAGVTGQYSISIDPYREDFFGIRGLRIFLSSKGDISKFISCEIGNNARMTFSDIVGSSPPFSRAVERAKVISKSGSNVLLTGESGVGKDVFAQAIHNASSRRNRPFVVINCAAIPKELIASELFGYDPGAFTGARRNGNIGKFELADGGTLFLDELGDMPLDLQAVLLRAIEQKSFMRVGGSEEISVDVKIIAATNQNLMQRVQQRRFREDLYYRISTTVIRIPPLRDRKEDLPLLVRHFLRLAVQRLGITPPKFMPEAIDCLSCLNWPGNIRELQNFIEGLVQLEPEGELTAGTVQEYYYDLRGAHPPGSEFFPEPPPAVPAAPQDGQTVKAYIPDSREQIAAALLRNHYNRAKTAAELQISRSTLYRRMREYGIEG